MGGALMADLTVPKGDYGYQLVFTVQDSAGDAYNLTDYTITLKVWREGLPGLIMSGVCTILVAASGTCHYVVVAGAFNRAGNYKAELELTKSGTVESTQNFDLEVEQSY